MARLFLHTGFADHAGQFPDLAQAVAELLRDHDALALAGLLGGLEAVVPVRVVLVAEPVLAQVGGEVVNSAQHVVPDGAGLVALEVRHVLLQQAQVTGLLDQAGRGKQDPGGLVGILQPVERAEAVRAGAIGVLRGERAEEVLLGHAPVHHADGIIHLQVVAEAALVDEVGIHLLLGEIVQQRVPVRMPGVHAEGGGPRQFGLHLLLAHHVEGGGAEFVAQADYLLGSGRLPDKEIGPPGALRLDVEAHLHDAGAVGSAVAATVAIPAPEDARGADGELATQEVVAVAVGAFEIAERDEETLVAVRGGECVAVDDEGAAHFRDDLGVVVLADVIALVVAAGELEHGVAEDGEVARAVG